MNDLPPLIKALQLSEAWHRFRAGALSSVCWDGQALRHASEVTAPRWLLPGSFNPIHAGHRGMAQWVARRRGEAVDFELSLVNVEKAPLSLEMLAPRLAQFANGERLWLTRAATFAEKSRLFCGSTFLVGADTMVRVVNPQYHAGSDEGLRRAWRVIAEHDCRFLVFGRKLTDGFRTLEALSLPPEVRALCEAVSEGDYRADISSSEIRAGRPPAGEKDA